MKTHSRIAAGLLASTTMATMMASQGFAQDNDPFADEIEDVIIVTATRRREDIQDVPIAVTALSPELLQDKGVVNIQDLAIVAPSFASSQAQTNSGSVVLRIRGVGTTSNNIGFESAVGVFIDGAYQSRPGVALGEFVDVERVEVLRGPQGTLFGRNTSAGALNVVNASPDIYGDFGGFANFTYGNYDLINVQGALNIPIVQDKVAARLTGAYRSRDGYIDVFDGDGEFLGASNSVENIILRGQVGFEANNGLEGRIIADFSDASSSCCVAVEVLSSNLEVGGAFAAVGAGARGGMSAPNVPTSPTDVFGVQNAVDNLYANASFLPTSESDQFGLTANLQYPISDNADLVYVGSYREYTGGEAYDSDFSGLDAFNVGGLETAIDTMTHELRVQGDALDSRLSYLFGGYYSNEKIDAFTNFELGPDYDTLVAANFGGLAGPAPLQLFTGVNPDLVDVTNNYTQDSTTFSVFTHNVFDITDKLDVTVGLRYTDESKDGTFGQSNFNNPLCPAALGSIGAGNVPAPLTTGVFGLACLAFTAPADLPAAAVFPLPLTFDEEFKDDELVYTGKLGYEFTNDISAYASFTHGYKSGGFNLDNTAAIGGADPRFLSETVDAYEIGLKSRLFDNRLTLNVAGFIENFENFQVLEFTGAQFTTFNVPEATAEGVEIETFFTPMDGVSFNAALTLLDASYPDDCAGDNAAANPATLCGNSLTNAPDVVSVIGAQYDRPITDKLNLIGSFQMRYESDRRTSTQATVVPNAAAIAAAGSLQAAIDASPDVAFDVQDANRKINLRIGIAESDGGWALEGWANNVTNELTRGVTFNTVLRGSSRSAFVQDPRTYGVTLRTNF